MKLVDAARELIGTGADATLVTLNADGSPQVTLVWVTLQSTPYGDELVTAHLAEHKKVRNVRRDPRVAVTIVSPDRVGDDGRIWRSPEPHASSRVAHPNYSKSWARRWPARTRTSRRTTLRRDT